jgi:hypothetical protein
VAPSGPDARTAVLAGTGGSSSHCGPPVVVPGALIVAARPPGSRTHAPLPWSVPDAMIPAGAGSGADSSQFVGAGCGVPESGAYAYQPAPERAQPGLVLYEGQAARQPD